MDRLCEAFMASSRTIKTLTALLAAMTVGVFTLMLMETEPYQPPVSLAALGAGTAPAAVISDTEAPIHANRWRNIVVRATGAESADVIEQCHFVLTSDDSGRTVLASTALWRAQQTGRQAHHLGEQFNTASVGVCLVGDFSTDPPTAEQFNELMTLVKCLQKNFHIGHDRVYLLGDIDPLSRSPGDAFPARAFEQHLIR